LAKFEIFLKQKLKPRTVYNHAVVISHFIDVICWDWNVSSFLDIRRGIVCSRFWQSYCSNTGDSESQANGSVKKFFTFLVFEQGIAIGKDILTGLKIKVDS